MHNVLFFLVIGMLSLVLVVVLARKSRMVIHVAICTIHPFILRLLVEIRGHCEDPLDVLLRFASPISFQGMSFRLDQFDVLPMKLAYWMTATKLPFQLLFCSFDSSVHVDLV